MVEKIKKELKDIPRLNMKISCKEIPTEVPVHRPNMKEFSRMWDCINYMGTTLGGRHVGMAALIPPKEWQHNIWPIERIHSGPRVNKKLKVKLCNFIKTLSYRHI